MAKSVYKSYSNEMISKIDREIGLNGKAVAVQHNLKAGFLRLVFRECSTQQVAVIDNEETEIKIPKLIFYSAHQSHIKNTESRLKEIIQKGYVKEKISFLDIPKEKIEQLESDYDAEIKKDSEYLIIRAIKENAIELKSKLPESPSVIYGSENSRPKHDVGFDMRYSNQLIDYVYL